jgi:hypothetical protein
MKHLVALLPLIFSSLYGESLRYSLLPSGNGESPSARVDGTIAYEPAGKRIFLFGGLDEQGVRNDLWVYSLAESRWSQVNVDGPKPAARLGHTLVLDSMRRRLILFGGQASGFFSDVWAFDIAGGSWRQLSADNAGPTRRYGHSAIYEMGRDRIVISHGFTNSGRFDDTWAFSLATNTWRDMSPRSGRPLRRCLHHAVYDSANGEMLLYGGCSSGSGPCPQGDLWSFNLTSNQWTERTPRPSPAGREHYGVAYDPARARMVMFGGTGAGKLGDTWEYDPAGRSWLPAPIEGEAPSARSRHQGVAAADLGSVFFFGGATAKGYSAELWMLASVEEKALPMVTSIANAFSGEGGGVAPGEVVTIAGVNLGPLEAVPGEFDEESGLLPRTLADIAVTVNGVASPLYLVSEREIRVQIPYEVAGSAEAAISVSGGAEVRVPVVAAHPGVSSEMERDGDVVTLFGTGQGVTAPASETGARPRGDVYPEPEAGVTLRIGGREVEVLSKGQAAGLAGVIRVLARVPEDVEGGDVVLTVGEASSRPSPFRR